MRFIWLLAVAVALTGCYGGADQTGTTPQRTTPANSPSTTGGTSAPGTGQNNPSSYGAGTGGPGAGSGTSGSPGTDAARP